MATAESADSIGKDPEQVEAEQPDDDEFMAFLDDQEAPSEAPSEGEQEAPQEAPSREELWQVIQDQQEQMDAMAQRIEELEAEVDEVQFEADTIEEVAKQFRNGEIGGPAGAQFLREFVTVPDSGSKINARSKKLFFTIIEERRVGKPVRSKDVVKWLNLHDSANPSVKAKRIMERLERHREDGFLIGEVETGKYRGQNCIWLNRD
jgi:hypothetical protein